MIKRYWRDNVGTTMLLNKTTPTDKDIKEIQHLVTDMPLAVFQQLNKVLNSKKMCLSVTSVRENN